ncbi:MAG: hypothetical protein K2X81_10560 [Candidatus Obscuribacterales bacterium]|nr:hypothetical protein [Candidatus Obscuribacterales bacterium]
MAIIIEESMQMRGLPLNYGLTKCQVDESCAASQVSPLLPLPQSGKKVKLLRVFPLASAAAGDYHGRTLDWCI